MRLLDYLEYVRHRVAVALEREARLGAGVEWFLAERHGVRIVQLGVKTLDAV